MSRTTTERPGLILRVGFILLTVLWFTLVAFGWILVSTPETGRHSHVIGWISLTIATGVLIAMMDHWIKYAQVFLGFGIIGGLVMLVSGRFMNSDTPAPRVLSAAITMLFVGCSLIIGSIAKRRLRLFDRVALVGFVVAFASAMYPAVPEIQLVRIAIAFGILLTLWLVRRYVGFPVK